MSWFNFQWSRDDIETYVTWKRNAATGQNFRFIDESRPDPQADEISTLPVPIILGDTQRIERIPTLLYATPATKSGRGKRPQMSKKDRLVILAKKHNKCNHCGNMRTLEIHHIDGDPWNMESYNLQVLCHECHQTEETRLANRRRDLK